MIKLKLLIEGVRLDFINKEIKKLRSEWDILDSQGRSSEQHSISKKIKDLQSEKQKWDAIHNAVDTSGINEIEVDPPLNITELIKTDLTSSTEKHKYFLVYKSHLFILDDKSDLMLIKTALKTHPDKYVKSKTNNIDQEEDVYSYIVDLLDLAPDITGGEWYPDTKILNILGSTEINPSTSLNIKKASKQLGAKRIEYNYINPIDFDILDRNISTKKLKGDIPKIMFHGTVISHLKDILKYGLDPGRGPSKFSNVGIEHYNHIFLASTLEIATFYADNATKNIKSTLWEKYPIILEINVPDPNLISPDFDADVSSSEDPYYNFRTKEPPHRTSMKGMGVSRETGKWGYKGRIPSSFIRWIYYYNTYKQKWHKSSPRVWRKLLDKYDLDTISYKLGTSDYGK